MKCMLLLTLMVALEVLAVYHFRSNLAGSPGFGRDALRLEVTGLQR
ncbi:MAG: hypothetical protein JO069_22845 [Verrucomicrobia bacterium]|nr:hypothetical protein [Verrucomicrobiota bacterium]